MAMASVVVANILKGGGSGGGVLLLSCRNRCGGGRRSLQSTCSSFAAARSSISHYPHFLAAAVRRRRRGGGGGTGTVRWLPSSYFTAAKDAAAAAEAAVTSSSSSSSTPADTSSSSSSPPAEAKAEADPIIIIKEAAEMLDIRVGRIIRAWRHEEADSLYVEEVDVGEPEPRLICSGLVNYIPLHHLQDKKVVVLANLKPRNMRGVKSCGMLMAASDASHENVELLLPPEDSLPGERIWFGSEHDKENQPTAASPNQIQKKKIWELVQPHLKTDASCSAVLGVHFMRTSAGVVACRSLTNANIS